MSCGSIREWSTETGTSTSQLLPTDVTQIRAGVQEPSLPAAKRYVSNLAQRVRQRAERQTRRDQLVHHDHDDVPAVGDDRDNGDHTPADDPDSRRGHGNGDGGHDNCHDGQRHICHDDRHICHDNGHDGADDSHHGRDHGHNRADDRHHGRAMRGRH